MKTVHLGILYWDTQCESGGARVGAGKVAIVGAGRLGTLLAQRLPAGCRKVIIARRREQAQALADEVGGVASDSLAAVRGAQAVLLAVPGEAVSGVLSGLAPHLDEGALVVNMAPDLLSSEVAARFPRLQVIGAKLIGHAGDMLQGAEGAVVLEGADSEAQQYLEELFRHLGVVLVGREAEVQRTMAVLEEEMGRAATAARHRLEELGLAPALVRVALRSVAPGLLRDQVAPMARETEPAWQR